jgi:hypothetical protein
MDKFLRMKKDIILKTFLYMKAEGKYPKGLGYRCNQQVKKDVMLKGCY